MTAACKTQMKSEAQFGIQMGRWGTNKSHFHCFYFMNIEIQANTQRKNPWKKASGCVCVCSRVYMFVWAMLIGFSVNFFHFNIELTIFTSLSSSPPSYNYTNHLSMESSSPPSSSSNPILVLSPSIQASQPVESGCCDGNHGHRWSLRLQCSCKRGGACQRTRRENPSSAGHHWHHPQPAGGHLRLHLHHRHLTLSHQDSVI